MRYILRIAKISVNISDIFCKSQKIPLKIPQKNTKKTYGSYMWQGGHYGGYHDDGDDYKDFDDDGCIQRAFPQYGKW